MVPSGLSEEEWLGKVVWKFARPRCGALSAMTCGITTMLVWLAGRQDSLD